METIAEVTYLGLVRGAFWSLLTISSVSLIMCACKLCEYMDVRVALDSTHQLVPLISRGLLLELLISRTPLQLLWQQCSPSKEGHILLRYILASLTAYTEYNAEQLESGAQWGAGGGTSQTLTVRGTERSETTLSEVGNSSGGDIYVAMTREENVVCLQRLYTEHAQCLLSHDAAVLTRVSAGPSEDSDGREVRRM